VRHGELVDEALKARGFFERIEVFTLNILDQRHGQGCVVGNFADLNRHFGQTGDLAGAPAALAGDDLVAAIGYRPHEDRLHYALGADRGGQLFERAWVHAGARLIFSRL
jgi:hypothetical protein